MLPQVGDGRDRVRESRDVLERLEDSDERRRIARLQPVEQRDLVGTTHHINGHRCDEHDDHRHEMERVARAESPGAVARGHGIEVHERTEDPGQRIRNTKEVRVGPYQAGRVVDLLDQVDGERRDQHREQAVGGPVAPMRGERAGQKKTLDGTDERGEVDPVDRHVY